MCFFGCFFFKYVLVVNDPAGPHEAFPGPLELQETNQNEERSQVTKQQCVVSLWARKLIIIDLYT